MDGEEWVLLQVCVVFWFLHDVYVVCFLFFAVSVSDEPLLFAYDSISLCFFVLFSEWSECNSKRRYKWRRTTIALLRMGGVLEYDKLHTSTLSAGD